MGSVESGAKFFDSDFNSDSTPELDDPKIKKNFEVIAPANFRFMKPFTLNVDKAIGPDETEATGKVRKEHEQMSVISNGLVMVTGSTEKPYLRSWDPNKLCMTKIMKTPGEIKPFPAVYNSRCLLLISMQLLVSAGRSHEVYIWNINKKRLLRKFEILEEYKMFEATSLEKIDNMHFVIGGVSHLLQKNVVVIYNQLTGIVTKFRNFVEKKVKYEKVLVKPMKLLRYWLTVVGGAEIRFFHISTGKQFYSFIPEGKQNERPTTIQTTVLYGKDVLLAAYKDVMYVWEISVDLKRKKPNFKLLHKCDGLSMQKMLYFNSRYVISMVEKELVCFNIQKGKVEKRKSFKKDLMSSDCRDLCFVNDFERENIVCVFANQIVVFRVAVREDDEEDDEESEGEDDDD